MKLFSAMALALALGLSMTSGDAEAAKRLGSGKSTGMQKQAAPADKSPSATPAQTPAAASAAAPAAAGTAAAAAPKRSWMGPVAGLAAGLGLAALASHLGFGEELASMLMFGLLAMAVMVVIGLVMRKRAAAKLASSGQSGGMQYAGMGQQPGAPAARAYDVAMPRTHADAPNTAPVSGSLIGSGIGSGIGANLDNSPRIPADFDTVGFERSAKVQFIRLQAANDAGNLDDIREFTTPEMFAELKMDMAERNGSTQHTDVVSVNAQVVEVAEEDLRYVVSVRFTGLIREETNGPTEAFDEMWHLTKPRQGQGGWLLSGIQQMG
ncbi:MAG: transporter [Polaromonas sp.]|nr:transporter [Polaromonas sp.]